MQARVGFLGLSLVRLEIPESLGRVTPRLQVSTQAGELSLRNKTENYDFLTPLWVDLRPYFQDCD